MAGRTYAGRDGTSGNTNKRAKKRFAHTFAMPLDFGGVAKRKPDWFFIEPAAAAAGARHNRHLFEPDFPLAMQALNEATDERPSDPCSMTVDLPWPRRDLR